MQFCGTTCGIAVVFVVANLYLTFTADKTGKKSEFYQSLSRSDIQRYEAIIKERRDIYLQGYLLGIVISVAILFANGLNGRKGMGSNGVVCLVGAVTLVVNYLYYMIHPKSDYMILHLNEEKQREEWLRVYRDMQLKYHVGLVFGIVAAMALAYSTC